MKNKHTVAIKLLLSAFYFLVATFYVSAQDSIVIQGELINNSKFAKVIIKKFGIGAVEIGAVAISDGKFKIIATDDIEAGIYRLQYSQSSLYEYVDVILNGTEKEIAFSIDVSEGIEQRSPVFSQSEENKKWYRYSAKEKLQLQKIGVLQNALARYPNEEDKIVKQLQEAIDMEQQNQRKYVHQFLKENAGSWAAAMVANKPVYFTDVKKDWRLQDFDRRNHYWDGIDCTNPKLINTPLFTEHILNYLRYYMNPEMQFSEEEMNTGFKKSVDTIMQKFGENEITQKFALQYLQLGFKELGNDEVLQYIDENYAEVAQQCLEDQEKESFDKRMAGYTALAIGNVAPDIRFTENTYFPKGVTAKSLSELDADHYIVVFAAGWCPHCTTEIPKLAAIYEELKAKNTEVVLVSLDETVTDFASFTAPLPFVSTTDYKKWEGQAANDYHIYGTPTYIVLDKDKKIVGKYVSFNSLKVQLDEID